MCGWYQYVPGSGNVTSTVKRSPTSIGRLGLVRAVVAVLEPEAMPVDSGLEIALVLDVDGDLGALAAPSAWVRGSSRCSRASARSGQRAPWRPAVRAARDDRHRRARRVRAGAPAKGLRLQSESGPKMCSHPLLGAKHSDARKRRDDPQSACNCRTLRGAPGIDSIDCREPAIAQSLAPTVLSGGSATDRKTPSALQSKPTPGFEPGTPSLRVTSSTSGCLLVIAG